MITGLATAIANEDDTGEHRAEQHHPPDDGLAALAVGPAVGERPAELLFEGEEEPGRQRECGEPQRRDRGELLLTTERARADAEEGVGGDACDQQRQADGEGALGEWGATARGFGSGGHQDHESIWRPRRPGVMRRDLFRECHGNLEWRAARPGRRVDQATASAS